MGGSRLSWKLLYFQTTLRYWKQQSKHHPCGLRKSCSFHPDNFFTKNYALGKMTVYIILKS